MCNPESWATAQLSSSEKCAVLALALANAFALASKRAVAQATQLATSGGRAQGLRREVTGMDACQALGPRMGPTARSSREQARSEGTPERSVGAG